MVDPKTERLRDLIQDYLFSRNWTRLADSTRAVERYYIKAIESEFGDLKLSTIAKQGSRGMFLEWHADIAEVTPRGADMRLGRLQTILKYGCNLEKLDRNPLATFERVYTSDRSELVWLPEHFAKLNASKAIWPMKFAAFLALHTGQRRGDLIALKWSQYDGVGITLVQSKSKKLGKKGRRVYIPATKALKEALDKLLQTRVAANGGKPVLDQHILLSRSGKPYTSGGFRIAWQTAFELAAIDPVVIDGKTFKLHFHDIRGTAVTMLAESGATVPEIATVTGHSLTTVDRILERYLNRTRALAESAIAKLELKLKAS